MKDNVRFIANLLENKHAKNIEVYEVGAEHPLFDTVVVASVDVKRNLDTIVNEVKKAEKENEIEVKAYDTASKEWVIIDCYDMLIHIFVKESREFYDVDSILERYVKDTEL
ncbi:ribosome silencing factor [Mycoplasma sp. P36-A1]|uniref:ribosome silencing factor n=1 Tax=Mycoplasma sp. P36-A1 TaxID=3252900 RepID=UPI003C2C1BAB